MGFFLIYDLLQFQYEDWAMYTFRDCVVSSVKCVYVLLIRNVGHERHCH